MRRDIICNFYPFSLFQHRAISIVRNKGPLEKSDPNAVKKKISPLANKDVEQRVESNMNSSTTESDGKQHLLSKP